METDDTRRNANEIVPGGNQVLAQRSSALISRGLRDLSGRDVATFVELGKALTSCLQLDRTMRAIMEKLDDLFHPDTWYLLLSDQSEQELYFELAVGKESSGLRDRRVKLGEGIAGWVAENSEAVVAIDAQRDPRFRQTVDGWPGLETRSLVAVPVCFQNHCLGVIGLVNFVGPDGLPPSDLSLLQALGDFAAIAIENARHVKAIHGLTIKDETTGLYNARHLAFILDTEIYRSERYSYEFSLLFLDLDRLKDLRKSLSYARFIQLMNELGEAFKRQLRLIDFAFYYGDGEFTLLLPQTSKDVGRTMASRLHKFFRDASWMRTEGQAIQLPARIGVAAFPEDGKTKADLLHAMDEAMYLLKKSSADGVVVANVGILSSL
jgi:diguanylate cyclase (GGDEF)-like protein